MVRVPPSAAVKRNLSRGNMDKIPEEYRATTFGLGMRWRVNWYEIGPGGRQRLRARNFALKDDAEAEIADLTKEIRSGRHVSKELATMPFGEAARRWRAGLHLDKQSTAFQHETIFRAYVLPQWSGIPLNAITKDAINRWIDELREGNAPVDFRNGHTPRKPSTRYLHKIVYSTFGAVLRYAVSEGWLTRNPMNGIRLPTTDPNKVMDDKVFLQPEELKALADAAAHVPGGRDMDRVIVYFLAYTGLRIGECFALRVGDVDAVTRRVTVSKTKTLDANGHATEGPPKNGSARTVVMPPFIMDMIRPYINGRDIEGYLFTTARGKSLDIHNWRYRVFSKAKEGGGLGDIKGLRPHSLRHTFASYAINAGCDVRTLAALMGHRDITQTLNTYAGLWPDRLGDVADSLQRMHDSIRDET